MDNEKRKKRGAAIDGIMEALRAGAEKRKNDRGALIADIAMFMCAFFFSRRHTVFGCYPLGASLVAVLPSRVWIALAGSVIGSLTLGRTGIIHAIISLLILFLRIIISGGGREGQESLFSEPLIMRLSAATVGAFVGAGYEMLLSGFSFSSVLFGVFGVLLTLITAFVYSGLFFADISVSDLIYGGRTVFRKREGRENLGLILFKISISVFSFITVFSLSPYSYFGISLAYLFAIAITLFVTKRFGMIKGVVIGFISTVGVAPVYSPAFALIAVGAALLFEFGISYAIVGAGLLFVGWGSYVGKMSGFLALFPEYLIASLLIFPALRRATAEEGESERGESNQKKAEDMVGASWLRDTRKAGALTTLEGALFEAAIKIRDFSASDTNANFDKYREIVLSAVPIENHTPCSEIINKISTKLYKKQKLGEDERASLYQIGVSESALLDIVSRISLYERGLYEKKRVEALSEEYELIAKMINESMLSDMREHAVDETLTSAAKEVFARYGFPDGDIRVYGDKKKRIIGAGRDSDGSLITSPTFKCALESALRLKLGEYEYFRKEDMALFKCAAVPKYLTSYATASEPASERETSGDSSAFFKSGGDFISIISDGMGSGREARESADFVTRYLTSLLSSEVGAITAMTALNQIIRHKGKECTATLDLFRLDLLSGDAVFIKSGAAPSFVKRDKSIFRIRSETAPLGLIKSVDAEKIRVEVKAGDYVIMLSDGLCASVEDSPWLVSYLSKEPPEDIDEYARSILDLAKERSKSRDDMTVSVIRIGLSE